MEHQNENQRKLLCMECAKLYDGQTCPVHPDEPLLDPNDEDVVQELRDTDDRRRSKLQTMYLILCAGVLGSAGFGLGIVIGLGFYGLLGGLATGGGLGTLLARKMYKPKFSPWTGEVAEEVSIVGEMGNAAKQEARSWVQRLKVTAVFLGTGVVGGLVVGLVFALVTGYGEVFGMGFCLFVGAILGFVVSGVAEGIYYTIKYFRDEWAKSDLANMR